MTREDIKYAVIEEINKQLIILDFYSEIQNAQKKFNRCLSKNTKRLINIIEIGDIIK